jgi:hypothetical protein
MEARRQALLISQMKRKEKISSFKEDKKNELDERREQEGRKQEMAEQRKLEREIKRLFFESCGKVRIFLNFYGLI